MAIIGPSGSGKSTLLNIIGTLDFATEGDLTILDQQIEQSMNLDLLRGEKIGFIFQLHNLIPNLTLLENVVLALKPRLGTKQDKKDRARHLLTLVGLGNRIHFLPTNISGGERQRCAIARALANDPPILLGDEPTGNLDSETGMAIIDLLLQLADESQKNLIIVTHDPDIAQKMNRCIKIVDGKIFDDSVND